MQTVNPSEEYMEFTEKHRSLSVSPVLFRFDDQLIEDTVGKLQPNQLTVDNLTVDWLRQRMMDLEISVKECQDKYVKLQSETNGKISPSAQISPTTTTQNTSSNGSLNGSNGSLKELK